MSITSLLPISEQKVANYWDTINLGDYMVSKYANRYIGIGENIKKYRKQLRLSQEALADKMCMSRSYISKIEAPNCEKSFSVETLFIIADALEIPTYKLLQFNDEQT
ncbi:helix-turn-helix domain-containing protein [Clostridium sp.]|uniref:helix-turn-helix domain-containing protein n=1 Tax=Clostridium sp. TaxID=1506 RepID=UPI003D6D9C10